MTSSAMCQLEVLSASTVHCLMLQRFGDEPMPPHVLVAAGALAGLAASTATFPLEVRAWLHTLQAAGCGPWPLSNLLLLYASDD